MRTPIRIGAAVLAFTLMAAACGDSAPIETSADTTVAPSPAVTTLPSTDLPPTTLATTTTLPPTATTTTVAPQEPTLAAGTLQVGFFAAGEGATLPAPPFSLSIVIGPEGGDSITYELEDPDPGFVEGDGVVTMTTVTFVVPLVPGSYRVDAFEISDPALRMSPLNLWMGPLYSISPGPRFVVAAEEECSFMGQLTVLYFRVPPGDAEQQLAVVQELAEGAEVTVQFDPDGTFVFSDAGLDLLKDEGELALPGARWLYDGEELDISQCADLPAEF